MITIYPVKLCHQEVEMPTLSEEIVEEVRKRSASLEGLPGIRMVAISLGYTFVELDNGTMGVCFTPRSDSRILRALSQGRNTGQKTYPRIDETDAFPASPGKKRGDCRRQCGFTDDHGSRAGSLPIFRNGFFESSALWRSAAESRHGGKHRPICSISAQACLFPDNRR